MLRHILGLRLLGLLDTTAVNLSFLSHLDVRLSRCDQNDSVKYISNLSDWNILILKVQFQCFSFLQTYLPKCVRKLSPLSHSLTCFLLLFVYIAYVPRNQLLASKATVNYHYRELPPILCDQTRLLRVPRWTQQSSSSWPCINQHTVKQIRGRAVPINIEDFV